MMPDKKLIGFSAVNTDQHSETFNQWVRINHHLFLEYDEFGGFARTAPALEDFIVEFKRHNKITLEPVYTGKMMHRLFSLIEKRRIEEGSVIIALHTGGLQGIKGFPDLHSRLFTS
jgi:1-aminocyclopropane-1-carboxylate deaminase